MNKKLIKAISESKRAKETNTPELDLKASKDVKKGLNPIKIPSSSR